MNQFKKDLNFGLSFERKAINTLMDTGKYKGVILPPANKPFKYWDFKLLDNEGNWTTYEVKAQRNTEKYNTLIIEYEYRNKPSGITTSTADYYIVYSADSGRVWTIKSEDLRTLIKEEKYERILECGNGKCYTFSTELFKEGF